MILKSRRGKKLWQANNQAVTPLLYFAPRAHPPSSFNFEVSDGLYQATLPYWTWKINRIEFIRYLQSLIPSTVDTCNNTVAESFQCWKLKVALPYPPESNDWFSRM